MNPKHISIGVVALLFAVALYYFTSGAEQITAQMKMQIENELTSLKKEGFSIQNREIKEEQEHFTISFDQPKKIADFLNRQGVQINVNDAELFKGLQVGVDVNYLADAYSAVSFELYPVSLPTILNNAPLNKSEKEALAQVQNMLEKKTFLMHIAINKLGTGFKGYMKDIQEVLHGEQDVNLSIKRFTFFGDIKNNALQRVTQKVENLSMQVPNELDVTFKNFNSAYTTTGNTPYDYVTKYTIEHMKIYARSQLNIEANTLTTESESHVKDGLASGSALSKIKSIKLHSQDQTYTLENLDFNVNANNLDITALDKLQEANVYNEQEVNAVLQRLISKGIHVEIPSFSIATIIDNKGKTIDGFHLSAQANVDKSLDITTLESNPMIALSAIDANVKLELSNALYRLISQQPQAIMLMMLFQPKDVNGTKVYELELKNGTPIVNGLPLL